MNVKEAVTAAKSYILEIFAGEQVTNLGLEEVEFDEHRNVWLVTIGFSRPWDAPPNLLGMVASNPKRTYKTVQISGESGAHFSIKNREVAT
ncbi:MAG TPA: hypothetical protein PLF40_06150 [Kofleriaceae bacterium]|nr:hypothetical protein [Kofleriaceae bacterium]